MEQSWFLDYYYNLINQSWYEEREELKGSNHLGKTGHVRWPHIILGKFKERKNVHPQK